MNYSTYTLPLFTRNEVAAHNNRDDLWMILDNKVYDITHFPDLHPGGREILMEWAGKDATRPFFHEVRHSVKAKSDLKQYLIGQLIDSDREDNNFSPLDRSRAEREETSTVSTVLLISAVLLTSFVTYKIYHHYNSN